MSPGEPGTPQSLPVPDLADEAVALRPWAEPDAPALAAAWADPSVARWTAVPDDRSEEAARRWILGEAVRRQRGVALDLAATATGDPDAVLGEVGLGPIEWGRRRAAVGFWLAKEARGRGLATRVVDLLAGWALASLPLDAVVAESHVDNPAAGAVLAAAGFERVVEKAGRQAWARGTPTRTVEP